jgi:hypothetical protein
MILGLILGIATGLYARHKGYSFIAWFFAGGLIGLIALAFLPDPMRSKHQLSHGKCVASKKQGIPLE